jgi:triphosphatase
MELDLGLDPDDADRLPRLALLAALKTARARSRAIRIVWHDSPDRALARHGLALAEQRPGWRLEQLHPDTQSWPPGLPPPVLATARDPATLGHTLPDPLVPMAAFDGRSLNLALADPQGPMTLTLLTGTVHTVAGGHRISRLALAGAENSVQTLAVALSGELRLAVPRASLAAEALAIASGVPPPPRRQGAAELPTGLSVAAAFSHVVGHLTDVILHFAPIVAADRASADRDSTEPVHQMRVAVRRLRSAIKVFRPAVRCPAVDAVDAGLKALAARLAPTRDWDVFVTETLAAVIDAFPAETRLQRLSAVAERRRQHCHNGLRAFLHAAEFRRLGIELACLAGGQAWQANLGETEHFELGMPLEEFAAGVLNRRLKRLSPTDDDLAGLAPAELHALRLRAKRLRYAAEIFAPLHAGKPASRFIRRLATLQTRLGVLNDGAVARTLLHELAGTSGTLAFASGLVVGFVGAHGSRGRARSARAWQKFHRAAPFWQ